MKTFKKISAGVGLFVALLAFISIFSHQRAYALASSDFQQPPATYSVAGNIITANLGSGTTVSFVNNNPGVSPLVYVPTPLDFTGGKFCASSKITLSTLFSSTGQISVQWVNNSSASCISLSPSFSGTINLTTAGVPGATSTSATGDTSACIFKTGNSGWDSSLSWILCPVVNGLSSAADGLNNIITSQLNFSVNENLGPSVEKAWSIFRELASAILVIVMLVMVISQAIGGGPFDAYTIRKLLPRLAAAVILMQISWYLCRYAIVLANDAGQGIAGLLSVPFGGTTALDLPNLLNRLSGLWAAGVSFATVAGVITAMVFAGPILAFGWPTLVLAILLVFISEIVFMLMLLFRTAFLILLTILSPLAFLAFVLPGTDKYWKYWKDNFTKLLLLFPLIMAIIYGGRIFAWTAGNLGTAGPFDLLMVIVGFFGPYFIAPKAFKWGGSLMAIASKGVNESWPIKKGREVANKELSAAQKRRQNNLVDKYYQSLVRSPDGSPPPGFRQRAGAGLKRGLIRTAGGHPVPTKRATRVMMQEAGKWKEEEIALGEGKINNDYKEFQKGDPSKGIAPMSVQDAKKATRDLHYDPTGKNALNNRAFFTWAYDTKSFMEMGDKDWRMGGIDPNTGEHRYKEDMFKTQGWIDFMHGNPNAYGDFSSRLGASSVPYRLPLGGGPKAEDYLPGGKRYEILGQETIQDADGKVVPNVHYNPELKKLIDNGDPRSSHFAELEADSERFTKLIDQAEDPAAVVAQRPEEFEQLKKITAELEGAGVSSVGKLSLKNFIDKESTTLGGRNLMQRLTGAAQPHIDAMFGDGYIQSKIAPRRGDPDDLGGGGQRTGDGGGGQGTGGGGQRTGDGGGGGQGTDSRGYNPRGVSTASGAVNFSPSGTPYSAPASGVLKIDHEALAETIREASRQGTKQGFKQAVRESGLHQPGQVFQPGQESGQPESNEEDNDANNT